MKRSVTPAGVRARNKYNEKAYDRLYPAVKKGKRAVYAAAAEARGMSLNKFIESACDMFADLTPEPPDGGQTKRGEEGVARG